MSLGADGLAKFEDCLQRLEKIVQELEAAEGKVEILLKQNGKLQAEPFEPLTEKAPGRK